MNTAQILPDLRRISCSGSFLDNLVEKLPYAYHIRDSCSEKYLMANHQMAHFCGLKSIDDIIGNTRNDLWIQDIANRRLNLKLNPIVIAREEIGTKFSKEIESQILLDKLPRNAHVFSLDHNGKIIFDNIIKIPISDNQRRIIAFLSIFIEKTNELPLYKLFQY